MTPTNDFEEWNLKEQAGFNALRRQRPRPKLDLEDRVVHALQARGLIQMSSEFSFLRWQHRALALAAVVLLLALGFGWGKWQSQKPALPAGHSLFVLFLYDGNEPADRAAAQVEEYRIWAMSLRQAGKMIMGEKLKDTGRILRLAGGHLETDEIVGEPRNFTLGGYFLIAAQNLEEALRIAAGCPHLRHGGTIALREIDPT